MSEKKKEEWVLSKENIQPIQHGKRTKVLKGGLASCTDNVIGPQLHSYENELRTYSGDDPLSVWFRYISWVEQNIPKGHREGQTKQLIERCLSTLRNDKGYFNDDRFVDIMLKYAILDGKPMDVYNYMYSNKIGYKSAKFYINWSQELEQLGNLKKADEILVYGIKCKAEPLEKLLSYYKNFEIRFSDELKSNSGKNLLTSENSRSAFEFVKPQKRKLSSTLKPSEVMIENKNLPLVNGNCQPQMKSINTAKIPFKINDSENIIPPFMPQSHSLIPSNLISENYKENEQKPSKWNEARVKAPDNCLQAPNTVKQTFKFYCDEENEQNIHTLRSDATTPKFPNTYSKTFNPPVALFEPEDPSRKPMYPKNKVYRGTKEFSLEEIRAAEWLNEIEKAKQTNLIIEQQKKIEEQQKKGEELKKQVETLTKQVELLLQSHVGNSGLKLCKFPEAPKLNTDFNSLESIDTASIEINKLKAENFRAFENCENSTQHAYSDLKNSFKSLPPFDSNSSLNIKSSSSAVETKDPEGVGFLDAAEMVQEFYNRTLPSITEGKHKQTLTSEFTEKCSLMSSNLPDLEETSQQGDMQRDAFKEFNHNLPFSFYHDPTGVIIDSKNPSNSCLDKEEDPLVSPNVSSDENIENIPPKDYVQESSKRELAGILQPSKNILFIPLEEQEEMDDNSDIEEDYVSHNERQCADDTLIPPSNTEQFSTALFFSSTPYLPRNNALQKSGLQNTSESNNAPIVHHLPTESPNARGKVCDLEDKIKTDLKFAKEQTLPTQLKMLSAIMETSRETYSKSSSSSSGSLTRSNNLDHILSNRISMLKQYSKLEACEPSALSSISDVSQGISETNYQNVNEIPHKLNDMDLKVQLHTVDFDPFDQEINHKFLNSVNKGNYKNLYYINKAMRGIKEGENINIGNESYRIISLVAEGAYAKIFEAVKCAFVTNINTKKFALKVCKNSDEWEFYICDELQKRLLAKNMSNIRNSVINVISAEKFLNGIVLVFEFGTLGTLLDAINFYKKKNSTMPELIIMYFTLEILLIVSKLHECNIIHGDIKPDNFLFTNDAFHTNPIEKLSEVTTLKLIDFGRAIDLNFYNKGTCFTSVLKSNYFKCNEMKDKKPWVFQLDWHGVASCIYTMLFSDYMAVKKTDNVWVIDKKLKRYWCISLWDSLFNKLLNIPECYQEPDIQSDISTIQLKLQQNSAKFLHHFSHYTKSYKTEK